MVAAEAATRAEAGTLAVAGMLAVAERILVVHAAAAVILREREPAVPAAAGHVWPVAGVTSMAGRLAAAERRPPRARRAATILAPIARL